MRVEIHGNERNRSGGGIARVLVAGMSFLAANAGCVFYGASHDECLDTSPPEECDLPSAGSQAGGSSVGTGGSVMRSDTGGAFMGGASGSPRPRINEVRATGSRFVEIYNAGSERVKARDVYVTSGISSPEHDNACPLPGDIPPRSVVMVKAAGESACDTIVPCGICEFTIDTVAPTSTIYLLTPSGDEIASVQYPGPAEGPPLSTESWCAVPDGAPTFVAHTATPGMLNGEGDEDDAESSR